GLPYSTPVHAHAPRAARRARRGPGGSAGRAGRGRGRRPAACARCRRGGPAARPVPLLRHLQHRRAVGRPGRSGPARSRRRTRHLRTAAPRRPDRPRHPEDRMTALPVPADSPYGPDNLPYGVYSTGPTGERRVGLRLSDRVLDLAGLLDDEVFAAPTLNPFLAQGRQRWAEVRARLQQLVAGPVDPRHVHALAEVTLHLPFEVGDYVDFYASEHHATHLGQLFRPGQPPLTPNWKHLPIGYHGRGGSVVASDTPVRRPQGQRTGDDGPVFGPSVRLDIEC